MTQVPKRTTLPSKAATSGRPKFDGDEHDKAAPKQKKSPGGEADYYLVFYKKTSFQSLDPKRKEGRLYVYKQNESSPVRAYRANPNNPSEKVGQRGYEETETGQFIIVSVESHVSTQKYPDSRVKWNAPVTIRKVRGVGDHSVFGVYEVRSKVRAGVRVSTGNKKTTLLPAPDIHYNSLKEMYSDHMDKINKLKEGTIKEVTLPYRNNTFGPRALKTVKDKNLNGFLDPEEEKQTPRAQFIHSIKKAFWSKLKTGKYGQLDYSHGCIRMFPGDIEEMISKKYVVAKETVLIIRESL